MPNNGFCEIVNFQFGGVSNSSLLGGCKTGQAIITKGYNLSCDYIIYTVVPVWNGGEKDEAVLLANCYYNSMTLVVEKRNQNYSISIDCDRKLPFHRAVSKDCCWNSG